MNEVNQMGLRVALLVGLATLLLLAIFGGVRWLLQRSSHIESVGKQENTAENRVDSDSDGLPDLFENIYRTDATNPDSDGDGISDYEELTIGRDPAVPGPNDVSKPPTGADVFNQETLTAQYLATLPTDAAREEVLSQERLEAFVELHRGPLLPELPAGSLTHTSNSGIEAITAYLEGISSTHNENIVNVTNDDIESALAAQLQLNPAPMNQVVTTLVKNKEALTAVPTPEETVTLHTKLLQASIALHNNVILLRDIDDDFVGGLIASKNIDDLGAVFQDIAAQVAALEAKYELE